MHSSKQGSEHINHAAGNKSVEDYEITAIGKEVPLELLFRNVLRAHVDEDIGKNQILVSSKKEHIKNLLTTSRSFPTLMKVNIIR